MKGRSLFTLLVIVVMAFGVTGIAMAAPATAEGQCFGSPPDTKDEDGSDGWDIYAPEGFVFTEAEVKAGTDCFENGVLYSITGIGTNHVHAEMLCEEGPECHAISHLEGNWGPVPPTNTPTPEDPTATPTDTSTPEDPTATPTPTDTPTEGPSPTPTVTDTPGGPTSTPPPPPPEEDKSTGASDGFAFWGLGLMGLSGLGWAISRRHRRVAN